MISKINIECPHCHQWQAVDADEYDTISKSIKYEWFCGHCGARYEVTFGFNRKFVLSAGAQTILRSVAALVVAAVICFVMWKFGLF